MTMQMRRARSGDRGTMYEGSWYLIGQTRDPDEAKRWAVNARKEGSFRKVTIRKRRDTYLVMGDTSGAYAHEYKRGLEHR